jgi:hypothetical protein
MGASAERARPEEAIQVHEASAGPLPTTVLNATAGGLRFSPGGFQHDVVMKALYEPAMAARPEPNGTSRWPGRSE